MPGRLICVTGAQNAGGAVFTGKPGAPEFGGGEAVTNTCTASCPAAAGQGPGGYGLHPVDALGNRMAMDSTPLLPFCSQIVRYNTDAVALVGTMTSCGHAMTQAGMNGCATSAT